jgi:glycosyltransferase involved in cell wall biosynthesis
VPQTQNSLSSETGRRVALVFLPWKSKTVYKFLNQVVSILTPLSTSVTIIGGNTDYLELDDVVNAKAIDIRVTMHDSVDISPLWFGKLVWAIKAIACELLEALALVRNVASVDIVLFYMSYPYDIIPLVTAKLLGKKTVITLTRSGRRGKGLLSRFYNVQDTFTRATADVIALESDSLVSELKLVDHRSKLAVEGYRYVDTDAYCITKNLKQRSKVGFVSRLEAEKGILNFLHAARLLHRDYHLSIPFVVAGDGRLRATVETRVFELKKEGLSIDYTSWIPEDEFCQYLNELKVLVFPTSVYAEEGLPTIVIEAMACGTPVLTTPVAAIPDVIKDESTGFFIKDTSPECIAKGIIKVLNFEDLEKVQERARGVIEDRFSYEDAVRRWRQILYRGARTK